MKDRKQHDRRGGGRPPERRGHKDFSAHKPRSFQEFINPPHAEIADVLKARTGEGFSITGVIEKVVQTGGPTVFYINDGSGLLALKAFEKAGVRAYAHVDVGDAVKVALTLSEYNGEMEGEVSTMHRLNEDEQSGFEKRLRQRELERAHVDPPAFLVKSVLLDKLKARFVTAATAIRLAVFQNRPIIVRHHNDTDGYSAGYALERAILPLVEQQHTGSPKATWEFYTRAPCAAPMYEIDDSIRDTAHSLSNAAKFSNKMPLVLIVDTGSGAEDLLGIQQGRVHGIDFIVVDHHRFEKDVISDETLVHINPFLVEEDGATFSAGMLCTELARFINPSVDIVQIPAMAGMADRINNPEVMKAYEKLAAEKGYDTQLLADIATVIDFVSAKLRFMEAREYIEVLFGEPMAQQKKLVSVLAPYIRELEAKGLAIAQSAVQTETIKGVHVQTLEIEKTYSRGFYPKPGRCVSMIHDHFQVTKKTTKAVTLGVMSDALTIRGSDDIEFSVPELITYLNKKLPEAFVEGGGHRNAGSIKFVPSKHAEVMKLVREYIKTNN
ncbi:MAG: hypothetical protein AABX53_01135 [Nanoarchaeota archaeon]|mgnify:FL=1